MCLRASTPLRARDGSRSATIGQIRAMVAVTRRAQDGLSIIELLADIVNINILAAMLLAVLTIANTRDDRVAFLPDFKPFGLALTICTDRSENPLLP